MEVADVDRLSEDVAFCCCCCNFQNVSAIEETWLKLFVLEAVDVLFEFSVRRVHNGNAYFFFIAVLAWNRFSRAVIFLIGCCSDP